MATYNTVIKKRNTANSGWDSVLPITTGDNVLLNDTGDTVASFISSIRTGYLLTVGKNGEQFTTINAAITQAKKYCTVWERVTIKVSSGTYNEQITLMPNPGIDIVGSGADITQIVYPSVYPYSPIYTVGRGVFKDLAFICEKKANSNAYALHFESQTNGAKGIVKFEGCIFVSSNNSAIGFGLGDGASLSFNNCDFASMGFAAIYGHNYPADNVPNQMVEIRNSKITSYGTEYAVMIDDAAAHQGFTNSKMSICFNNCNGLSTKLLYRKTSALSYSYIPSTDNNISLSIDSQGNNILGVNYLDSDTTIGGICYISASGYGTISIPNAINRNYTIFSAVDENNANVISALTIGGTSNNYVILTTSNAALMGKSVNVNIYCRAS